MVLFAPDEIKTREDSASTWWTEMQSWENVWIETRDDQGLIDLSWDEVVKALVATI
jgi:hypothetical protein